jgi:hypothetical protein
VLGCWGVRVFLYLTAFFGFREGVRVKVRIRVRVRVKVRVRVRVRVRCQRVKSQG